MPAETTVLTLPRSILSDDVNRAMLAADASAYYRKNRINTHYLDGLREELAATEKALGNLALVRSRIAQDEGSIKAFFEKYADADFDDSDTRDTDDGHYKVVGRYWDFEHEIDARLVIDLPERASAFEYGSDLLTQGFVYFADGAPCVDKPSLNRGFLLCLMRIEPGRALRVEAEPKPALDNALAFNL